MNQIGMSSAPTELCSEGMFGVGAAQPRRPFQFRDGTYAWFVGHPDWEEGPGVLPTMLFERLRGGRESAECRVYATLTEALSDLAGALARD
jgi:hypothetical protein